MIHSIFLQTWQTTPIVTKIMSVVLVLITFLVHINILNPLSLTYSLSLIKNGEIWRTITSFFYFGPVNIEVLLHIVFFFRYSKMLEEGYMHTSDYLYLIIYCCFVIFILANIFKLSILSTILSSAITYIWTRRNRTTQVQLLGCIIFPAFYLPFIVPAFSIFSDHKVPFDEVLGIFVGQSYYYLKYVVRRYGIEVLATPFWIKALCKEKLEKREIKNEEIDEIEQVPEPDEPEIDTDDEYTQKPAHSKKDRKGDRIPPSNGTSDTQPTNSQVNHNSHSYSSDHLSESDSEEESLSCDDSVDIKGDFYSVSDEKSEE